MRDAKNEESDLRINGSATDAQLEWKRQGDLVRNKKAQREDLEAFETAYNAACGCVARGELAQAGVLLQRAKGKSQASNGREMRLTRYRSVQCLRGAFGR